MNQIKTIMNDIILFFMATICLLFLHLPEAPKKGNDTAE